MDKQVARNTSEGRVAELRELASRTAEAALTADPAQQTIIFEAAEQLGQIACGLARKSEKESSEPAIAILPSDATVEEVRAVRRRQAMRRGTEVYLPSWSAMAQTLPNVFLRSALFSARRRVQGEGEKVLSGDHTFLVAGKEIASYQNMTLTFSGYKLCQFDRRVYATCLDYYREMPLSPEDMPRYVKTSFYDFARRMGNEYSMRAHKAIRTSLLRLSFAQLRLRYKRMNIEVPKLLSVTFKDGEVGQDFKGSDKLLLRIGVSVAELFGPSAWTAVDKDAAGYDGLMGWLASFYASHSTQQWLPVERLRLLSGYKSHKRNFKASLIRALEKLKAAQIPDCSRVAAYYFSKDGIGICVVRSEWGASIP